MLLTPAYSIAQNVIPDEAHCDACTIVLTPTARLAVEDVTGLVFVRPPVVVTDSRSNHWVLIQNEGRIAVFDSTGALHRIVGRQGDGPAEFRWPSAGVAVADSVLIFDERHRRAVVFGPNFEPRRTITFPDVRSVMGLSALR